MNMPKMTASDEVGSNADGKSRRRIWTAAATGLVAISVPIAVLAAPASAEKARGVAGANKKLTALEAKAWADDLQYGAARVGVYCASKSISKLSPPTKVAGNVVWALAGADPCKIAKVLFVTSTDLRNKAAKRPYFGFTVEHHNRRFRPDTCIARLTVVRTARTFSFPAKGGGC